MKRRRTLVSSRHELAAAQSLSHDVCYNIHGENQATKTEP